VLYINVTHVLVQRHHT